MIVAGELLLERPGDADRPVELASGYVRIEGEVITEVARCPPPASADLGGPGCLVAPGLVDTHVHLPQFSLIGAHGLPLLEWLEEIVFPAEAQWADAAFAARAAREAAGQLLAHGSTAVCAYSTIHHEATAAAIEQLAAAGLRGVVGMTMSDRAAPDELVDDPARLLDQTADLLDRFPPGERVAAAITPRFAVSCSAELLEGAGRLAAQTPGAAVQTHLSETLDECRAVAAAFGGRGYTQVYADAGLLTPRTLLGHGVWLDPQEQQLIAQAGAVVAHCPTANAFLRAGDMRRDELVASGLRLSLGSDVGAGYERSMVRVARAMIQTASRLGDRYPTPAQAWAQITHAGADAAGLADAGRLAVGAPADLIVAKPTIDWQRGRVDPLARLLFAWDDRWLRTTLCRGAVVYAAA
ncbi:amidohydrolase family protein [Botrimarina sp.]|uniref:amidohydrolase family protein n=1 Tax=Botrimarina sp. TaxID=2795802 RepID=UPI0032EDA480